MKPRQTPRNFLHNPSAHPAQTFQAPSLPQQQSASSIALPPLQPPAPTIHPPIPPALRDVDLTKLGLNFEDKSNIIQQLTNNPNMLSQDDIMKCFQAIYGKNGADILQNRPAFNDLTMQAISSPDHYPKIVGGTISSNSTNVGSIVSGASASISSANSAACSRDSVIHSGINSGLGSNSSIVNNSASSSGTNCTNAVGSGGGASGAASFNNNISKNNNGTGIVGTSQHNKQDIPFINAQQHQAAATSSAINNFRVPTTNAYHNSPLLQSTQQQKSVLSIHQQQYQSDRRFNNHHQNTSASSTSFSNLNLTNMSGASSSSSSTISTTPIDSINSNQNKNNSSNLYSPNVSGLTTRSPQAVMDALKVHSSLENLIESGLLASHGKDTNNASSSSGMTNNQQALPGHQHLQRLLKASGIGSSSSTNQLVSQSQLAAMASTFSSNMPSRNDLQNVQSRGNVAASLNIKSQSIQNHLSNAISPTQTSSSPASTASHSLPKSLLNLAACSTSPHDTGSKLTALNQLACNNTRVCNSQKNLSNTKTSTLGFSNKSLNRGNTNNISGFSQKSATPIDPNELLQQIINSGVRSAQSSGANIGQAKSRQTPQSLLSDDQSSTKRQNQVLLGNVSQATTLRASHSISSKQQANFSPDESNFIETSEPRDHFLANLQGRAAKAGVSIDEINDKFSMLPNNIVQSTANQQSLISISTSSGPQSATSGDPLDTIEKNTDFDTEEIESALSRVEARNDLSLLYPPVLLGSNSQKQLNALSAGFQTSEESELFTSEVKRIVSEECNIIYECKQCSNLFRSLANLVKHKRSYCTEVGESSRQPHIELQRKGTRESQSTRNQIDITKQTSRMQLASIDNNLFDNNAGQPNENLRSDIGNQSLDHNKSKYNLRGKVQSELVPCDYKSLKQGLNRDELRGRSINSLRNLVDQSNRSTLTSTSLSKLLQSQPRNRLPSIRDNSALMNALRNKPSGSETGAESLGGAKYIPSVSADLSDIDMMADLDEQLVSKSSLAQTLLNESAKISTSSASSQSQRRQDISPSQDIQRHVASKRKLEDCISKVKRGKLGVNESVGNPSESEKNVEDGEVSTDKTNHSSSSALLRALTKPSEILKATQSASDIQPKSKEKQAMIEKSQKGSSILAKPQMTEKQDVSSKEELRTSSPLFESYTCDICKSDFKDQTALYSHTLEQHKTFMTIYPCIFCSLSFIMLENVCRHIMDIHKKGKMQVIRLKEVVRSRSYISEDFTGCNDYPSTPPIDQRDQSSQNIDNNDDDKSSAETMTPRLVITEETTTTSQSEQDASKSSPSLKILEDTISVSASTSSSQEATSKQISSQDTVPSQEVSQQSTSIQTQLTNDKRVVLSDSAVDGESDLLSLADTSDEDLVQLCEQEEAIARLKVKQETVAQRDEVAKTSDIDDESKNNAEIRTVDKPEGSHATTKPSSAGVIRDDSKVDEDKVETVATCQAYESDWSDKVSVSNSDASDSEEYVIHEEGVAEMESESAGEQADTFSLSGGVTEEASQCEDRSQNSSPFHADGAKACNETGDEYMEGFPMPEDNSMDCNNIDGEDGFGSKDAASESDHYSKYEASIADGNEDGEDDGEDDNADDDDDDDDACADDEDEHEEDEEDEDDGDIDEEADSVDDDEDNEYNENDDERQDDPTTNCKLGSNNNSSTPTASGVHGSASSSSASGGGGGMKLKIQLKTQPDEKTKVYRIV